MVEERRGCAKGSSALARLAAAFVPHIEFWVIIGGSRISWLWVELEMEGLLIATRKRDNAYLV